MHQEGLFERYAHGEQEDDERQTCGASRRLSDVVQNLDVWLRELRV
jgi:hypothetical protein